MPDRLPSVGPAPDPICLAGPYNGDVMFLRSAADRRFPGAVGSQTGDVFLSPMGPKSWKSRLGVTALVLLAWAVVGFLQANVIHFLKLSSGYPSTSFVQHLPWSLIGTGAWALFTPLVVRLARWFPITGPHPLRNWGLHFVFGLCVHFAMMVILLQLRESGFPKASYAGRLLEGTIWDLMVYLAVVAVATTTWLQQDSRLRREQALRLEAQLARSRFEALTLQLQPHFLFNSLNAISELVYRDPKLADYALTKLAELLRRALASSGQLEGTLEEEVRFLETYAEIERLRSGGTLRLEWDIPEETRRLAVPVLILQPLIENAFRHGIRDGGADRVDVSARVHDGTLSIVIQDNGRGFGTAPVREGLGLRNTRERLESLYGNQGNLELLGGRGAGVRVELSLPARPLAQANPSAAPGLVPAAADFAWPAEEAAG